MATPEKKRKSTRHFNLEKRGGRHFDLEKEEALQIESSRIEITQTSEEVITNEKVESSVVGEAKVKQQIDYQKPQRNSKIDIKKNGVNTAKKPVDSAKSYVTPDTESVSDNTATETGSRSVWMWIVGGIIVVAIIVWLCVRGCSSSNAEAPMEPAVETVDGSVSIDETHTEQPVSGGDLGQSVSSEADSENSATAVEVESTAQADDQSSNVAPVETTSPSIKVSTPTVSEPAVEKTSGGTQATEVSSDVEAEAMKVIRGVYGTGIERKLKLGSKYREIQNRVNELKRQGVF